MSETYPDTGKRRSAGRLPVKDDLLVIGITFAAILMFVATGVQVVPAAVAALMDTHGGTDRIASSALLLNIGLIIFAWRRYKDAQAEAIARAEAEGRVEILATRDQLTNLLVRQSIGEHGKKMIDELQQRGEYAAMLVVNLDRFKNINDAYGHVAGDTLLRTMAQRIGAIFPPGTLCARIGADEFCVLLSLDGASPDAAANMADLIVEQLSDPVEIGGIKIHATVSVGMARTGNECDDPESLLRRANIAMHAAKAAGGGRRAWFDNSMESVLKARNEVESGLRRGLPLGEFVPFYQPQVHLGSGELCGFEALARWQHPAGGVVGPDLFIPVAEETGLIGDLFDSVLHQALADAKSWDERLILSVNVSPGQLKDPWLATRILKILTEAGFPPERLEVEITESSLFENLAVAQAIVTSLKNQGVRLALDDFGTGYSSLAHLRSLPFDRIKIDRSFVKTMARDPGSRAIVTAVASMGRSLGVPVTAEGVEEISVAEDLREIGCDMAQGWLFGMPRGGEETYQLLHAKGLLRWAPQAAASPTTRAA